MILVALIPLGIGLSCLAWGFLFSRKWYGIPVALLLGYLAYASFDGCWLILQEVSNG